MIRVWSGRSIRIRGVRIWRRRKELRRWVRVLIVIISSSAAAAVATP